ncbi:MAG: hypothetical protein RJA63_58 [Pseudomonadota bacterium]|jgi:hypothetical protein
MSTKINLSAGLDGIQITERSLLNRMFANLARKRGKPFWLTVHLATGHGSGVSMALCREFGYDPDTGKRVEAPK